MTRRHHAKGDRGESLLELLVAITILGVVVISIGSGVALGVRVSTMHRSQATSGSYVRSYAEAIDEYVAAPTWAGCSATTTTYASPPGFSVPSGYAASVTSIGFWDGSSQFAASCVLKNGVPQDFGLQQLVVTVADGQASEQLAIVIRKP